MTTLAVRHTVSDFDTWKSAFDGHATVRSSHRRRGKRSDEAQRREEEASPQASGRRARYEPVGFVFGSSQKNFRRFRSGTAITRCFCPQKTIKRVFARHIFDSRVYPYKDSMSRLDLAVFQAVY